MVAVPTETPVTIPVANPTEATPETLLVHVPPAEVLLSVVVAPRHTNGVPDIGATVTTDTVATAKQPVGII